MNKIDEKNFLTFLKSQQSTKMDSMPKMSRLNKINFLMNLLLDKSYENSQKMKFIPTLLLNKLQNILNCFFTRYTLPIFS